MTQLRGKWLLLFHTPVCSDIVERFIHHDNKHLLPFKIHFSKCALNKRGNLNKLTSDKMGAVFGFNYVKSVRFEISDMWNKDNLKTQNNVKAVCKHRDAILTEEEQSESHQEGEEAGKCRWQT